MNLSQQTQCCVWMVEVRELAPKSAASSAPPKNLEFGGLAQDGRQRRTHIEHALAANLISKLMFSVQAAPAADLSVNSWNPYCATHVKSRKHQNSLQTLRLVRPALPIGKAALAAGLGRWSSFSFPQETPPTDKHPTLCIL